MIHFDEPPGLVWPTAGVRTSYLVGEQADCPAAGDADRLAGSGK
jgi:hypothetical protein